MGDNSLITQEQMQSDLEQFYSQKIYPYLNGATHAGFTPVGSVIAIMGNKAPNHYLACDGTLYTIADYPQLTAYFEDQFGSVNYFGGNGTTTFAVPDLRGEFLRGSGTNSHTNQGSGANVGTHQDGTEHPQIGTWKESSDIQLTIDRRFTPSGNGYTSIQLEEDSIPTTRNGVHVYNTSQTIDITDTTPAAFTSRPTNTSVLWCIAYENTYIDGSGQSSGGGHKIQNEGDLEPLTQRKTLLLNEPLVASDDAEGGNTVIDVDSDVDLSVIHAPGTAGNVEGHIYSTDETVVGKWIDGKPVYEKTIDFGALPSSTVKSVNHNISSLNMIIKISAIAWNPSSNIALNIPDAPPGLPIQTYDSTQVMKTNNIRIVVDSSTVKISDEIDRSSYNGYITIQYTKV